MSKVYEYTADPRIFPKHKDILCSRQLALNEVLVLPSLKPDVERIVDVKAKPVIDTYKIINSVTGKKVIIKAHIEQELLYAAEAPCHPVHAAYFTWPFSTFIDLPCGCTSYDFIEQSAPRIITEYIEAEKICSREIAKTVIVFIWYPLIKAYSHAPVTCHGPRVVCQRGVSYESR